MYAPSLSRLIEALRCLPGVGPKSAQRIAFHLLERDRQGARGLADALALAADAIGSCERCRMFSEEALCGWCADSRRSDSELCVVESPADVLALDEATSFTGRYFVLLGHISPLDGIGPDELGVDLLEARLRSGVVEELILATNPTVEGDATAHFLADLAARYGITASRIAHGVPIGGELEYVDGGTLSHAFSGRRAVPVAAES